MSLDRVVPCAGFMGTLIAMSVSATTTEALELDVTDSIRVSAEVVALRASRACFVFRARRRRRYASPLHDDCGAGAGGPRHRLLAIPVSVPGAGLQAHRSATAVSRDYSRCRRGGGFAIPQYAAHRRRTFLRRPHDLTGPSVAASPGVRGLVFLGFPLHPAGRPNTTRAAHLADVALPMLFVQGTRDELATRSLWSRWSSS